MRPWVSVFTVALLVAGLLDPPFCRANGTIAMRGSALDNFLVGREQLLAESFINARFGDDVPPSVGIPINIGFAAGRGLMPPAVRAALASVEADTRRSFNF